MIGRNADQYKDGNFVWFIGEVKDINDSKNLNRVRVLAYGFYDGVKNKGTSTNPDWSDLPWATVMMPTTSASIKGNGGNHHLEVGSWVVGFFRDGPSAQDPIVMGSIATQTDGVQDIPTKSSVDNKVYESKAGHRIELDNTSGKEKIIIKHGKTGAFLEFNENNKIRIV
jgi:hypothetical protein